MIMMSVFSQHRRQNGSPGIRRRLLRQNRLRLAFLPLYVLWIVIASTWTKQNKATSNLSSSYRYSFVFAADDDDSPVTTTTTTITTTTVDGDGSENQQNVQRRQQEQEQREAKDNRIDNSDNKVLSSNRLTLNQILIRAGKRGLGGGIPGALAGVIQVLSLMWLRTITNYQCRYGTTFRQSFITLLNEGGIPRLYRGLGFALIQAPISRFVSTAANDGVESLLAALELTKLWGPGRTTVVASIIVGLARMMLMPIDTAKTVLQVDSVEGFRNLVRRVKAGKITVLYEGALASAFAAVIGHYPWFFTYSSLQASSWVHKLLPSKLLANAAIGFLASMVSDIVTNAARVVKTSKQALASKHNVGYSEIIRMIVAADGWKGLFGRGLRTRIMANALQSVMFTVLWRGIAELWQQHQQQRDGATDGKIPIAK